MTEKIILVLLFKRPHAVGDNVHLFRLGPGLLSQEHIFTGIFTLKTLFNQGNTNKYVCAVLAV